MKRYKYTGNIEKLLHQNQGEIIDIVEGSLIDNFLIATKRGYIALIETYQNCWSSYHVLNFSTNSNEINAIWSDIEARRDEA